MTIEVVRRRSTASQTTQRETFVVEESLGYQINYLAKAFARALAKQLSPHGVSIAQWAVLLVLWADDGPSQTELSRRVAIEDATMVRTIDRMERDGLVVRQRDTQDRRRIHVCLTEQGLALRDVLVPLAAVVNEVAMSGLTEIERDQARDLLGRMTTALAAPIDQEREGR